MKHNKASEPKYKKKFISEEQVETLETQFVPKTKELKLQKQCNRCKLFLPLTLDRGICPHCGTRN